MTAQEIRKKYLDFFVKRGHKLIPRASLVPQDDPTTLFTGSGMQPLVPYLLGQPHPEGKRLVDSQTCFRAEDMDEVGDNQHTTFFEMLGNWSLGDYFKEEQLPWFWEFLTVTVGLNPKKFYVTCFIGDGGSGVPKDTESAAIYKKLFAKAGINAKEIELPGNAGSEKGMQDGRIFYYDARYNWWSREGPPDTMREGEPGGPDSEIFYDFGTNHDKMFGENCHPNCNCGRFLEIGNSVFMTYKKTAAGFEKLPNPNVDFGGGLERLAAAHQDSPDIFQVSLIKPIINGLESLSGKKYDEHQTSMRVIADHLRAAVFLIADGVTPSNKEHGYVLRRLLRRAILHARDLGMADQLSEVAPPIIIDAYASDFPEINIQRASINQVISRESSLFKQTLAQGHNKLLRQAEKDNGNLDGETIFELYDTYGFPVELTLELIKRHSFKAPDNWQEVFNKLLKEQRERSRTASAGMFKGGLADHSEEVVKLHTTTHLMYRALKNVLGDHVVQRGSNITAERTRFDFSHPQKMTPEEIKKVEEIVNQKITEDLPVTWKKEKTEEALKTASGAFGDKYGDIVKVYTIGDPKKPFSREVCGGPHIEHTGQIGEGTKKFKIVKEESSSAGVRRIKAVLQ